MDMTITEEDIKAITEIKKILKHGDNVEVKKEQGKMVIVAITRKAIAKHPYTT